MPFVPDSNQAPIGKFVADNSSRPGVLNGESPYKDVVEAIPFSNALQEFSAGQRSGSQLLGNNLQADILGSILGAARSAGTLFNPISKIVSAIPNYAGATGSIAGGDLNAALRNITGSQPVQSAIQIPSLNSGNVNLDTLINGVGNIGQEVANQPMLLTAALPGALSEQGTAIRNFPKNISSIASDVSSSPLSQAISNTVKGTGNVISGTTKSIVKSILPQSVETQFVDALNPGSNPIQYQKAVKAAKTVLPDIQDVIDRSGVNFDSAAGARDVSSFAKNDIWSQIEQQTGQPIFADATPVADAFISVANNPVIKRLFPESIPNLEAEAAKYSGQQIPIQELEGIKQTFNALNQTKETISKSKKAALQKTDPIYAATDLANQAIGDILESKFGPEFTNQKLQYGAWKQINDLANKQAIKQEILNNKITPFEGLGILGAIAEGMANEGSLVRGAGTALAGKALKYVNSPDAKFSTLSRKLPNP